MTRDEWKALARRCENVGRADIEVDEAINTAVYGYVSLFETTSTSDKKREYVGSPIGTTPRYTASIDDILYLIDREFPSRSWFAGKGCIRDDEPLGGARIFADENGDMCVGKGQSATPALALCAAFCRAMGSKT